MYSAIGEGMMFKKQKRILDESKKVVREAIERATQPPPKLEPTSKPELDRRAREAVESQNYLDWERRGVAG